MVKYTSLGGVRGTVLLNTLSVKNVGVFGGTWST
jgi:hypothetical protein